MNGVVLRSVAGRFLVKTDAGEYTCFGRKKIKRNEGGAVLVGDNVEIALLDEPSKTAVLERVLPRKNELVRPPIANIDTLLIVLAEEPKPDFLAVDKLIINALSSGIEVAIVVNKVDIAAAAFLSDVRENYGSAFPVFEVSAVTGEGFLSLLSAQSGKTACLAGQSAVGKSSIVNTAVGTTLATGGLIRKSRVGRQTTRAVELTVSGTLRLADSCGFSVCEQNSGLEPSMLGDYYPDFWAFKSACRYSGCTHTKETECGVKAAVGLGKIKASRYNRYLNIFEETRVKWSNRF